MNPLPLPPPPKTFRVFGASDDLFEFELYDGAKRVQSWEYCQYDSGGAVRDFVVFVGDTPIGWVRLAFFHDWRVSGHFNPPYAVAVDGPLGTEPPDHTQILTVTGPFDGKVRIAPLMEDVT